MSVDNQSRIMEFFFRHPQEETHIRALARKTELHPNTIINVVDELKKKNLLKTRKDVSRVLITPDNTQPFFNIRKRAYHIESLYREGLITFLQEEFFHPTIVLFGSIAKGDERADSDLDLFIITDNPHQTDVQKYEERLGREIQLFTHNKKEWKKMLTKQPELANNMINGIVIEGYLEVLS